MPVLVVRKIVGVAAVAYNEQLHEAHEGVAVTVAGLVLVIHNLLHGFARGYIQLFQLNLYHRQSVNQQNYIVMDKTEHTHPKNGLVQVYKLAPKASKKRCIAVQKR